MQNQATGELQYHDFSCDDYLHCTITCYVEGLHACFETGVLFGIDSETWKKATTTITKHFSSDDRSSGGIGAGNNHCALTKCVCACALNLVSKVF